MCEMWRVRLGSTQVRSYNEFVHEGGRQIKTKHRAAMTATGTRTIYCIVTAMCQSQCRPRVLEVQKALFFPTDIPRPRPLTFNQFFRFPVLMLRCLTILSS
jgi:hypothetical protein